MEAPDITFPELRRSAIPDDVVELLRLTGDRDPEATITILIHYTRRHVGTSNTRPAQIAGRVHEEVRRAAEIIKEERPDDYHEQQSSDRKKRKVLNGVGKILAGAVTGIGNVLLATGTIVAPNPATAYATIGSSAWPSAAFARAWATCAASSRAAPTP